MGGRHLSPWIAAGALAVLAALAACGDVDEIVPVAIDAGIDAPPPPPPVVPVVRAVGWPGGGLQLVVEPPGRQAGAPLPAAWLELPGGARVDAEVAAIPPAPGATAVLLVPSAEPAEHAARLAVAAALVTALPEGERVAVYVAGEHAVLLADLGVMRERALEQLAAIPAAAVGASGVQFREVRDALADLESARGVLERTAVVVGGPAVEDAPEVPRPVHALAVGVDGEPAAAASAAVAAIVARRGLRIRLGACPGLATDAPFTLHVGDGVAAQVAPEAPEHLAAVGCDARAAAEDRFPYPSEIALTFTPAERAIFDQRWSSQSEEVFRTSVRLGDGTAITADAHLHGQGTLTCQRKSLAIQLDGARRPLMPGVDSDRFFLISMCQDERYFGQAVGDRLLSRLGLFAPRLRYVVLRLDGVNRGLYLMMEQPERALRDQSLATATVIRRRYDIDNQPAEAKYPEDPAEAAAAVARFDQIGELARNGPLAGLDAALDARVDLDDYTRLLAAYSVMSNGDYIDEAFFHASTEGGVEYYRAMGWDTDDLFQTCHGGGGRAISDRCNLTFCAEAKLDYALVRSPATYNRYLRGLDTVLARLTPAATAAVLDEVKRELWAVLTSDETAAALTEMVSENPGARTLAGARADIEAHMATRLDAARARHELLVARRATCSPTP